MRCVGDVNMFIGSCATQRKKKVDDLQAELFKLEEKLFTLEKELQCAQMGREKSVSAKP